METLARLTGAQIAAILRCALSVLEACLDRNLECLDPPAATTACLRRHGLSEASIKRLWARLPDETRITIFRASGVKIDMVLRHTKGVCCHLEDSTPLDPLDCRRLGLAKTSNANRLHVYFEGDIEGNVVRMNALRLLVLAARLGYNPQKLLEAALKAVEERDCSMFEVELSTLVEAFRPVLKALSPQLPDTLQVLAARSPFLRFIRAKCNI